VFVVALNASLGDTWTTVLGLAASPLHTFPHLRGADFSTKERNNRDWEEEHSESINRLRAVPGYSD
jgi:hypothetical protein